MKVLIVDDEPVARAEMRQLCAAHEDLEVVGEANSGRAAVSAAEQLCPDLLLLDVGLPDMTGFEVLQAARDERGPLAIVVTAREDHAVLAFTAGVVDYLLKPPSTGRFARAIERARARQAGLPLSAIPVKATILVGERDRRLYPLDPAKVHYVESDGNYVRFRTSSADYISRDSVKRLAVALGDMGFARIERSLLLNLAMIDFVEPSGHGTYTFTLKSGTVLQSSATYREEILRVVPLVRTIKPAHSA
jgi:two-component system LytT family response regulator